MDGAEILRRVTASGLRGRGGGWFPTGRKWHAVRIEGGEPIVVANGAEGEPGSIKDRFVHAHAARRRDRGPGPGGPGGGCPGGGHLPEGVLPRAGCGPRRGDPRRATRRTLRDHPSRRRQLRGGRGDRDPGDPRGPAALAAAQAALPRRGRAPRTPHPGAERRDPGPGAGRGRRSRRPSAGTSVRS